MSSLACDHIQQVIGVAYTYQPSLAMRRRLTTGVVRHHSSQTQDFSYFVKSGPRDIVACGMPLLLRRDVAGNGLVPHWPEPELAVLLGNRHRPVAYTLGNDLTAFAIEARGRDDGFDGTYFGKCWPGSCALGPRFVSPDELGDDGALQIEMRITRDGQQIYRHAYSTARRKRDFREVPDLVVEHHRRYAPEPPPSKRVLLDEDGWLAAGTVVMLGTGIIVPQRAYCQPGDVVTVSCLPIGDLTNVVVAGAAVHG
jgi:2-dehydro-3-deoxy-D-arabinonate dehydratase